MSHRHYCILIENGLFSLFMVWIIFGHEGVFGQNDLIDKKGLDSCHVGYCIGIIFIFIFIFVFTFWPLNYLGQKSL